MGSDRNEAIARMSRALDEVEIGGLKTNAEFHRRLWATHTSEREI